MLKDLLTTDRIRCAPAPKTWEAAVRLAAQPLIDCGAVLPSYVDEMIRAVNTHGPYIVLDEGFAMPHARPEAGAKKPCMSLLILDRPIDLLGESVQVLLALSAVDNTAHLEAMQELAKLIWNGCTAAVLAEAKTPKQAAALIDQYLMEENA